VSIDKKGHTAHFTWVTGDVLEALKLVEERNVDIVEMIGLLEYLDEEKAVRALIVAREFLREGGLLIVANVRPNDEQRFYKRIDWPTMYYRTLEQFHRLLTLAGFKTEDIEITIEPVKLHNIASVRK